MNKSSIMPEKAYYAAPRTKVVQLSARHRLMQPIETSPWSYTEFYPAIDEMD